MQRKFELPRKRPADGADKAGSNRKPRPAHRFRVTGHPLGLGEDRFVIRDAQNIPVPVFDEMLRGAGSGRAVVDHENVDVHAVHRPIE